MTLAMVFFVGMIVGSLMGAMAMSLAAISRFADEDYQRFADEYYQRIEAMQKNVGE
jgi:hypothetical protein